MIGAIIGAVGSAASSIAGGIISRNQAQEAQEVLNQRKKQNEDWYARRYNEDYTQTAEAQRALTQSREAAQRQMQNARGAQAVMGGTEESVAQTQDKANGMIADTLSSIAAQGTARKDAVESDYLQRKDSIAQQYQNMYNTRAQNAATQASSAAQGFSNFAGSDISSMLQTGKGLFGDQFKGSATTNTTTVANNGIPVVKSPGNPVMVNGRIIGYTNNAV